MTRIHLDVADIKQLPLTYEATIPEDYLDSMGHMNLISEVDSTYGISLTTDDTLRIADVASLKAVLAEHGIQ